MFTKRDIFKIIWPMIVQQILTLMVGTADSIMVASAGEAAVSGVSLIGTLDTLLIMAFSSLVTGGSVTVSHVLGRGDKAFARECAKQLIYLASGIALLLTVLVEVFRVPLLSALYGSADADVLQNANAYFMIMALSFPLLAMEQSVFSVFRVMGNTVVTLVLSICMNIVNIAGNAVFIYVFDMGVSGAALATLISRFLSAVVGTALLHSRKNEIYLERMLQYRPSKEVILKILKIGIPQGIENSMFQFGRLATQVLISSMGTAAIAANAVANTLANFQYMPSSAISNGTVTVVGRCIGAGNTKEAKKHANTLLFWTYISVWIVAVITVVFVNPILSIYDLSEEGTRYAFEITLFHTVCTALIRPLAFTLPSIFHATGDVKFSMVVSTISMWAVRVGLAFVLSLENIQVLSLSIPGAGLGIMGVWVAMIADWGVRVLLFTPHYLRGRWMHGK